MTPEGAAEIFRANGLPVGEAAIGKLLEYERALLDWNTKINLVSRRDTAEVFTRQIVASVAFLFWHRLAEPSALLDVGTGGGLPGVPLAILHPGIAVTMVDSIAKKVRAVSEIIAALGLPNARVLCARVEALDPRTVGRFEYIAARGVSSAAEIIEWTAKLLRAKPGGRVAGGAAETGSPAENAGGTPRMIPPGSFILLKGGDLTAELAQLSKVSGNAALSVRPLAVAGTGDALTDKKVIIVTP